MNTIKLKIKHTRGFTPTPIKKIGVSLQSKRGFSLLESLVAVSIFTASVLALLSVLSSGIAGATFAKNKIIATYLAQEGVEYVRNLRDTAAITAVSADTAWSVFKSNASSMCGAGCYLDDAYALVSCSGPCPALLYNTNTGSYNYTSGVSSGYIRTITVESLSNDEIKVNSTVTWMPGTNSITFSDNLFNWIE